MIHPSAIIEPGARIGENTRIWHLVHVREDAVIGDNCTLGHNVYVDVGVTIGSNVKLQNRVSVYRGVTIEDGVFVGPHATFTNDKYPRAITPDGQVKSDDDWEPVPTLVRRGASIGAGAIILPGLTIGAWAMIGAGALVTGDVPEHALVIGRPAEIIGYVCKCGQPMAYEQSRWRCQICDESYDLPPLRSMRHD